MVHLQTPVAEPVPRTQWCPHVCCSCPNISRRRTCEIDHIVQKSSCLAKHFPGKDKMTITRREIDKKKIAKTAKLTLDDTGTEWYCRQTEDAAGQDSACVLEHLSTPVCQQYHSKTKYDSRQSAESSCTRFSLVGFTISEDHDRGLLLSTMRA